MSVARLASHATDNPSKELTKVLEKMVETLKSQETKIAELEKRIEKITQ